MSWDIGDNRNVLLKLKLKLGIHHVVLTTPKTSHKKPTPIVAEMQRLPDIEKTDSSEEIFLPKLTKYNGGRKICVNFQTNTDKLNNVVDRCQIKLYFKDKEIDL